MAKEQRNIVGIKEGWSEFTLDDGAVIRTKAMLTNVERTEEFDDQGNPAYSFSASIIVRPCTPH